MKKTIKLNESDLIKIVKQVISEIDDKKLLKNEIFDILNKHFKIESHSDGFRFINLPYNKVSDIESDIKIPRFIFPWTWEDNETLNKIAYQPAKLFIPIYELSKNDLFKIVYKKGLYNLNYFENRKLVKELEEWKSSRIKGLENYYPQMLRYLKSEYYPNDYSYPEW
jgi:hypothetical protein